jgi:hypothetical protein
MRQIHLLGLITLFISITTYCQTTMSNNPTEVPDDWKVLKEVQYSIRYPGSWDLNQSGQMGTSFILFSRLSSSQDQFKENVNLIIQDLTGMNIDLDKYVEISEGQIRTLIINGNLLESRRLVSNGINYQKVIYTGKQGIYNLKFEQYFWVVKDKAFVLTLTCEVNEFEKYKENGEKILNSFKLKKN